MADLEKIVQIIFEGDDRTAAAFASVKKGMGEITGAVEDGAEKVARITDGIIAMDAALAAMAVGGLTYAVVKASDFSGSISEIGTLIDDSAFDIKAYQDAVLGFAQNSTQSIESITGALYSAISAGVDWKDSIAAVAAAEQLAVAGRADLQSTTLALLGTMNSYNAGMDEAERYSDAFFQTVKLGLTNLPELATSISQVSGIASSAGIPIETLGAAIAQVTSTGVPTAQAMTMIKAAIQAIINPSTEAQKAAEALGIEFNAGALSGKGFEVILQDVYQATGGNVEEMTKFFGSVEGLNGALKLVGTDGGDEFLKKLAAFQSETGTTAVAFDKMVDELEYATQRLVNTMKTSFIKVGEPLLEEMGGVVDALSEMFKGLNISIDNGAFDEVFDAINDFVASVDVAIRGVAEALPEALDQVDFTGLLNALKDLGGAFVEYLGGLDLSEPKDLGDALQNLVNIMTGVVNVTKGMVDAFRPYVQQVAGFFIELSKGDESAQKFAGEVLAHAKVISLAGLEIAGALLAMEAAGVRLADAFAVSGPVVNFFWENLGRIATAQALVVTSAAQIVMAALKLLTAGQNEWINENLAWLEGLQGQLFEKLKQDVVGLTSGIYDSALEFAGFKNKAEAAADAVDKFGNNAGAATGSLAGFTDEAQAMAGAIDGMPDGKKIEFQALGLSGAISQIREFGGNIAEVPREKIVALATAADQQSLDQAWQAIQQYLPADRRIRAMVESDSASLAAAEAAIEDHIPEKIDTTAGAKTDPASLGDTKGKLDDLAKPRTATFEPKTDEIALARLKGQLEIIQSSIEWKAKLDIAEVEAAAKVIEALADSLGESFAAAGEAIQGLAGALDPELSKGRWTDIIGRIDEQIAIQERSLELTESLVNKQVEFMQAKIDAMKAGEALIQIDGAGLQPHLEAFMWEILSAVQVRVNEEGHAMLFGL